MPMHFHRNLEFQYIESGCYRTVVDNKEYVFEKDEMVFIPYCLQHMADAKRHAVYPLHHSPCHHAGFYLLFSATVPSISS